MKRTLAALVALLLLAGCGDPEPTSRGGTGGNWEVITVDVDGHKVPCVVWDGYRAGGITCDWGRDPGCERDDKAEGAPKC